LIEEKKIRRKYYCTQTSHVEHASMEISNYSLKFTQMLFVNVVEIFGCTVKNPEFGANKNS
jgi:hypothetical protein